MKRRLALVLVILVLAVSQGCAEARYHLTVNSNGSGDIDLRVALQAEAMITLRGLGIDPLADLGKDLEGEGYSIEPYADSENMGITARKHVGRIKPDSPDLIPEALFSVARAGDSPLKEFEIKREFFQTRYRIEAQIDPAVFLGKSPVEGLNTYLLDQVNYNFILTLPLQPDAHNAHSTQDEGRTLIWRLIPGQANLIKVEASHWNVTAFSLSAIATILVFAGLAGAYYFKKKKEQK